MKYNIKYTGVIGKPTNYLADSYKPHLIKTSAKLTPEYLILTMTNPYLGS